MKIETFTSKKTHKTKQKRQSEGNSEASWKRRKRRIDKELGRKKFVRGKQSKSFRFLLNENVSLPLWHMEMDSRNMQSLPNHLGKKQIGNKDPLKKIK